MLGAWQLWPPSIITGAFEEFSYGDWRCLGAEWFLVARVITTPTQSFMQSDTPCPTLA